jgi:hypothetical protein
LNKLDKKVFGKQMTILLSFFNKQLEGDVLKMTFDAYYEHLQNVSDTDFAAGVKGAIATLKFFPTAKEIKDLCYGGKTKEQLAFERNSAISGQKQLTGYDDKEQCRVALENLNVLADCMKEGITSQEISEWTKLGKPLRSLLIKAKNSKKVVLDPEDYQEVFTDLWTQEKRVATPADYQVIARKTIEMWSKEDAC